MPGATRPRRDLTSLAVLALLAEQPRHPYDMLRLIRERRQEFVTGLPRSVYHAVERLLATELIEPAEVSRRGNRPERTVYRITTAGLSEYVAWVSELLSTPQLAHTPFSAAISLLAGLPVDGVAACLRARAAVLERELGALREQRRALLQGVPRVALLETEYAYALGQAELAWLRQVIADIERGVLSWDTRAARRVAALGEFRDEVFNAT